MTRRTLALQWLAGMTIASLLVVACGASSDSSTTSTFDAIGSITTVEEATVETAEPSSAGEPTEPPPVSTTSTTTGTTTTSSKTTTSSTNAATTPPTTMPKPTTTLPQATTTTTAIPTTTTTIATSQTVAGSVVSFGYNPSPITVNVGDTVRWTNSSAIPHTVTSSGNWDSGNLMSGGTFTRVFDTAGTFSYFCTIHGAAAMSATVVVNS